MIVRKLRIFEKANHKVIAYAVSRNDILRLASDYIVRHTALPKTAIVGKIDLAHYLKSARGEDEALRRTEALIPHYGVKLLNLSKIIHTINIWMQD